MRKFALFATVLALLVFALVSLYVCGNGAHQAKVPQGRYHYFLFYACRECGEDWSVEITGEDYDRVLHGDGDMIRWKLFACHSDCRPIRPDETEEATHRTVENGIGELQYVYRKWVY